MAETACAITYSELPIGQEKFDDENVSKREERHSTFKAARVSFHEFNFIFWMFRRVRNLFKIDKIIDFDSVISVQCDIYIEIFFTISLHEPTSVLHI